jgi:hypothetical protein
VVYGKRITLTARIHLADPGANPDITFSIDPARKPVRKLATVQANANGIARYTYVPHGGAKYTATYGGNARNQRASDTVGVMVLWKVRTSLRHNYSKSGQYLLFHQGATPLYLIAVMPAVRVDVKIVLQRWNSGWTTVASGGFNTNKDGGLGVVLNPRGLKIGNRYRLAVVAPNAIINGERMTRTTSSYSYFRITS